MLKSVELDSIVRQDRNMAHTLNRLICWAGIASVLSWPITAADQFHLLGSVDRLCTDRPYCFELRVEAEYADTVGDQIKVHYGSGTVIFDPENYELILAQSNIIRGSHLRMIIAPDKAVDPDHYLARFIWIGD
jgi:hypothetical protein